MSRITKYSPISILPPMSPRRMDYFPLLSPNSLLSPTSPRNLLSPIQRFPNISIEQYQAKYNAPFFTFYLRPRLIQQGYPCKLLCTVTGNQPLTVAFC